MKRDTIQIKSLSIGYKSKNETKSVSENITSTIYGGELTCLLGANGAGKSTLLRTLSAFLPKLSGEIYIQGREISHYSSKELSKIIGVVLTEKNDIRNLTVEELVGLGRSPYTGFWGRLNNVDEEVIHNSIRLVKIESLRERMVQTLSDGERQKVMIAKALAQETPVIYLDEPTAYLDFPSKVEIMQLLHHLTRETGKTIFLSTHDLELALQISDRIWLMDVNKGIISGTPEDLSLNGSLNDFFKREGVLFDANTGLFRIRNIYNAQIRLEGSGQKYAMVKKALQRNGVLANTNIQSGAFIDSGKENNPTIFIHNTDGTIISVQSIDELLEKLPLFLDPHTIPDQVSY